MFSDPKQQRDWWRRSNKARLRTSRRVKSVPATVHPPAGTASLLLPLLSRLGLAETTAVPNPFNTEVAALALVEHLQLGYSSLVQLNQDDMQRYLLLAAASGGAASVALDNAKLTYRVDKILTHEEHRDAAKAFRKAASMLTHRTAADRPWSMVQWVTAVVTPAHMAKSGTVAKPPAEQILAPENSFVVREALGGLFAALGFAPEGERGARTLFDRLGALWQQASAVPTARSHGLRAKVLGCFNAIVDEAGKSFAVAARSNDPRALFPEHLIDASSSVLRELRDIEKGIERGLEDEEFERLGKAPRWEVPTEEDAAPPAAPPGKDHPTVTPLCSDTMSSQGPPLE